MNLGDSGAIVVGGGSGLGEATARHIVASGGHCTIVDLDDAKGRSIAEQLGSGACFVRGDMTQTEDIERALDAGQGRALRLAVITAMLPTGLPVLDRDGVPHDLEKFRRGMEVNVTGTFNVLRLAAARMARLPPLEDGQRGVIIMTASIAAFEGQSSQIAYAAAKAAVVGMTLPAARDLAPLGIRVLTIAPGTFLTPAVAALSDVYRDSLARAALFPKRLGRADEYAKLVVHIFENAYLNAETIRLDGGTRLSSTRA